MNNLLKYITSITLLLLFSLGMSAQGTSNVGKNDVYVGEPLLSREGRTLIIEYDLELGQNVTSCEVELLISINGGSTFAPISSKDKLKGDIGRMTTSGFKKITYDIDAIKDQLAGKKIAFKVQVKNKKKVQDNKGKFFVSGTASTFGMYGVRIGGVKKFGGYLSYSDAFQGGMFTKWTATAGLMMRATPWLYPYAGAGYGHLDFGAGPDYEYTLIPFEVGAMFKLGPVTFSAAAEPTLTNMGFIASFEFGLGFCF